MADENPGTSSAFGKTKPKARDFSKHPLVTFLAPALLVVSFVLLVWAGVALVTPRGEYGEEVAEVTRTNAYQLWRVLIGTALAVAAASTVVTGPIAWNLWRDERYKTSRVAILLSIVPLILVVGFLLFRIPSWVEIHVGPSESFMRSVRWGMAAVFASVLLLLSPAILVMRLIDARLRDVRRKVSIARSGDTSLDIKLNEWPRALNDLRRWREYSNSALLWLGGIVSLVVLVTGQLRSAYLEVEKKSMVGLQAVAPTAEPVPSALETTYPVGYILVYGVMFAALISALYLPTYLVFRSCSQKIVDGALPISKFNSEWEDDRTALANFIGVGTSTSDHLKVALGTLAPFLTGLITYFLPGLK